MNKVLGDGLVFGIGNGFAHGNTGEGLDDSGFGDFILDDVDAVHQNLHLWLLDVLQYLISTLGVGKLQKKGLQLPKD